MEYLGINPSPKAIIDKSTESFVYAKLLSYELSSQKNAPFQQLAPSIDFFTYPTGTEEIIFHTTASQGILVGTNFKIPFQGIPQTDDDTGTVTQYIVICRIPIDYYGPIYVDMNGRKSNEKFITLWKGTVNLNRQESNSSGNYSITANFDNDYSSDASVGVSTELSNKSTAPPDYPHLTCCEPERPQEAIAILRKHI